MSKSHQIPMKGPEYDGLTGWRRWYCYVQRAGVRKSMKQSYNRRQRRYFKRMKEDS